MRKILTVELLYKRLPYKRHELHIRDGILRSLMFYMRSTCPIRNMTYKTLFCGSTVSYGAILLFYVPSTEDFAYYGYGLIRMMLQKFSLFRLGIRNMRSLL